MKTLPLAKIRTDGGTQMRAELNRDTYLEYRDVWKADAKSFPPLVVFHDGSTHWLADGFHRFYGAREAGMASVPVEIRNGTVRDAILYAVGANQSNGLRRTNADKRNAVTTLLNDEEWVAWSNREIADRAGVSDPFVSAVRNELLTVSSSPAAAQADKPRKGKDGKTRKPPAKKPTAKKPTRPPSQSDQPSNGRPDREQQDDYTPPPARSAPPERTVFTRLRELFDEMTAAERMTAGSMWADWMDL